MSKKVFIMRGVPGSGKSTYIRNKMHTTTGIPVIVSADHHFITCEHEEKWAKDPNSMRAFKVHLAQCESPRIYVYKANEIGKAHQACQDKFIATLEDPNDDIVIFIDNTNITRRELNFYVGHSVGHGAEFVIVNVICDVDKAAERNAHGVPREKVRQMAAKIEAANKDIPIDWPQENFYSGV